MALLSIALAVNSSTNQLLVTDLSSGSLLSTLNLDYYDSGVSDIVVTRDRQKAYISSFLGQKIYEVSLANPYSPQVLRTFNVPIPTEDLVLSADENYLMTSDGYNLGGSTQLPIVTVDLSTGSIAQTTQTDFQSIEASSNGNVYASSWYGNLITAFTIQSGNLVQTNQISAPSIINLNTSPTNPGVLTALNYFNQIIQYDSNLNQINQIAVNVNPQSGVFSPSGDKFYVVDDLGTITAYAVNVSTGLITSQLYQTGNFNGNTSYFGIDQIGITPDGTKLFAGIGNNDGLRVFDASNGVEQRLVSNGGEISGVAFLAGDAQATPNPDFLIGDGTSDKIYGLGSNDVIAGNGGNDYLYGDSPTVLPSGWGNGNDSLYGGAGNDSLYGADGNDYLDGGSEDDYLDGGNGNDTLLGGTGYDYLNGGSGSDSLDGGSQDDYLNGGWGKDNLYGGDGSDWLQGGMGNDNLTGGNGNDYFVVEKSAGRDYIQDYTAGDLIRLGSGLYIGGPNRNITLSDTGSNVNILYNRSEVIATVIGVEPGELVFG